MKGKEKAIKRIKFALSLSKFGKGRNNDELIELIENYGRLCKQEGTKSEL